MWVYHIKVLGHTFLKKILLQTKVRTTYIFNKGHRNKLNGIYKFMTKFCVTMYISSINHSEDPLKKF